jgi:DNA-binding CsgD family transcriptional regulator
MVMSDRERDGFTIITRITPANLARLGLTSREAEVVLMVGRGKSNAEIGSHLNISPRTVKKHLEHVFRKLGVKSRLAAVVSVAEKLRPVPARTARRG